MSEREEKIQQLKEYFEKRDDVMMAFLFGSKAEEQRTHNHSDWDIGVYFTTTTENRVEWEEQRREYPEEDKVWNDCMDILKTDDVDLIVLNRAPAAIADVAIKGIPLVVKDRRLWLEFMLVVSREAHDFRKTAHEYAEIYWRSASLSEEDAYSLDRRLVFLEGELRVLADFSQLDWTQYQENSHERRALERTIENIMNASIDISKIILASQKRTIPSSYREMVSHVRYVQPFSSDVMEKISSWAELRNILAHEYLDLRWKSIEQFLHSSESFIQQFIDAARKFLETNAPKE